MYLIFSFLSLTAIYLLANWTVPDFSYLKWDNFEFIIPAIVDAHSQWLEGVLPVWTKFVHLGDPLISNGQLGVFYFPHTLTLIIIKAMGLAPSAFPGLSLFIHSLISCVGWYFVLRHWKVHKSLAALAVISIVFGGMIQYNSQIWTDMLPCWAWFSILILGVETRRFSLVALAVAMAGMAAHPQQFFYIILISGFWCFFSLLFFKEKISNFKEVIGGFLVGTLLTLPSILPIFLQKGYSARDKSLGLEEFLSRGVSFQDWLGFFNPLLKGTQSVMPIDSSSLLFQGFWILPGLVLGLLTIKKANLSFLQKKFLLTFCVGVVALTLCMGGNTPFYVWTYHIPIWSSFRWPFKILYFCLPLIAVASATGWQMIDQLKKSTLVRAFLGCLLLFIVSFLSKNIFDKTSYYLGFGFLFLAFISTAVGCYIYFYRPRLTFLFLYVSVLASSFGVVYLTQLNPNKIYTEAYASVGKSELGITTNDRLLPLSTLAVPFKQQNMGFMHSGPMNNYESAAGCVTALAPKWRLTALPSDVYGVPQRPYIFQLLKSNLINSLNIGYVVVDKKDTEMRTRIADMPSYILQKETEDSIVYKNQKVLPKAFFVKHLFPSNEKNYQTYVMENQQPSNFVVAESSIEKEFTATSTVEKFDQNGGTIDIAISNSDNSPQFLVVSATWYPSWAVYVDGKKENLIQTNGTLLGVHIPSDAKNVVFKWEDPMLKIGFIGFYVGVILWAAYLLMTFSLSKNRKSSPL